MSRNVLTHQHLQSFKKECISILNWEPSVGNIDRHLDGSLPYSPIDGEGRGRTVLGKSSFDSHRNEESKKKRSNYFDKELTKNSFTRKYPCVCVIKYRGKKSPIDERIYTRTRKTANLLYKLTILSFSFLLNETSPKTDLLKTPCI